MNIILNFASAKHRRPYQVNGVTKIYSINPYSGEIRFNFAKPSTSTSAKSLIYIEFFLSIFYSVLGVRILYARIMKDTIHAILRGSHALFAGEV